MSEIRFHWAKGGMTDHLIGGAFRRLSHISGRRPARAAEIEFEDFLALEKSPASQIRIRLPNTQAFWQEFDGRTSSEGDLSRIAENNAEKLCPVADEPVTMIASPKSGDPGRVSLMQVRSEVLEQIETQSLRLGIATVSLVPEAAEDIALSSPVSDLQTRRERRLLVVGWLFLLAGLTAALSGTGRSLALSAERARAQETILRSDLLVRSESERQIGALGALAATSPERQTAEGRLDTLTDLAGNTPASAWWTRIELSGTDIRLTATGQNAGDVLKNLAAADPGRNVRFAQTVSDTADGNQTFVIEIGETRQ